MNPAGGTFGAWGPARGRPPRPRANPALPSRVGGGRGPRPGGGAGGVGGGRAAPPVAEGRGRGGAGGGGGERAEKLEMGRAPPGRPARARARRELQRRLDPRQLQHGEV